MIDKDSIERLNKWFDDKERSYDTSRTDEQYNIESYDLEDFCDYLRENEIDLIGIPCMVCPDGIWFKREDLEKARYI